MEDRGPYSRVYRYRGPWDCGAADRTTRNTGSTSVPHPTDAACDIGSAGDAIEAFRTRRPELGEPRLVDRAIAQQESKYHSRSAVGCETDPHEEDHRPAGAHCKRLQRLCRVDESCHQLQDGGRLRGREANMDIRKYRTSRGKHFAPQPRQSVSE